MTHDTSNKEQEVINLLSLAHNKIAELENKVEALSARAARYDAELSKLNVWHNSRIFGHVARIMPKSRSVIFCDSGFFGDNIKYAFLKFLDLAKQHGVECHYLAKNPEHGALLARQGLPCLPPVTEWTPEHYRTVLSAKVVVVQDDFTPFTWNSPLPYYFLQGAKLIQLWHGIPMKELGLLRVAPSGRAVTTASTGPADVLVAPGTKMKEDWAHWVAFREFAALGYPRNDVLLREPAASDLLNVDPALWREVNAAKQVGRKIIFYAPTFRDGNGSAWLEQNGLARIGQWCEAKGYFFFTKLHPVDHEGFQNLAQQMRGIRFADPHSDLYPLLRYVDVLVTDYSSLAFDFLLLDRPILFYRPDHAAYIAQCRNLRPDYERLSPGPTIADSETLCQSIEDACSKTPDAWSAARAVLGQELFDHHDACASDRVGELILQQLDTPQTMPDSWAF